MRSLLAAILIIFGTQAVAVDCKNVEYLGKSFTTCTVDVTTEHLRLFHSKPNGEIWGSFSAIARSLDVETLSFAMNAGMYHSDRTPVGLYLEDNRISSEIVTSDGPGNFGLLPNGVLCLTDTSARIYETLDFVARNPTCRYANQSGPMLVINGALHPRFLSNGTSRFIRNGVGSTADGKMATFVISNSTVTFHEFGSFFRDYLQLPDALYFDGKTSRLHAPQLGRSDLGFQLGPIIGVID